MTKTRSPRFDLVTFRETRLNCSLREVAENAGLEPVDVKAAIAADGWCGALNPEGVRVAIVEHGDELPEAALAYIA